DDLDADPGKVNADATGEGWLYRMKISDSSDLDDLMSEDDYKGYVEGLG
ncbi:MAG: glycine cleavage system protein H, partial [Proteobacteria bacterium]|nr:glycine cleavage system protein H [Pseudomonadota bacterium]